MKNLTILLIVAVFSLSNCTNSFSPDIEIDEDLYLAVGDTISEESISKRDSVFFAKGNYLFNMKSNSDSADTTFLVESKSRYTVIVDYQIGNDSTMLCAMFLYPDNTIDVLYNDFTTEYDFEVSLNQVKYNFPANGIFRVIFE